MDGDNGLLVLNEGELSKLADEIAERLFTNGEGKVARRLVLELENERNGGWSRKAVRDQVLDVFHQEFALSKS